MDITKESTEQTIKETLEEIKVSTGHRYDYYMGKIESYAYEWLTHQQSIISQLREEIITQRNMFHENAYKLAKVSEDAYIRELQDTVSQQTAEIERLRSALTMIELYNGSIDAYDEIEKILEGSKPNVNL